MGVIVNHLHSISCKTSKGFLVAAALFINSALGFSQVYEREYTFGQRDTQRTVKSLAMEDIRLEAANNAGTVVLRDTVIAGNDYRETLNLVSAALVRLTVLEERAILDNAGNHALYLKVRAEVDDELLKSRAKALYEDTESRERVERLLREAEEIRDLLSARLNDGGWSDTERIGSLEYGLLEVLLGYSAHRHRTTMLIDGLTIGAHREQQLAVVEAQRTAFLTSYRDVWGAVSATTSPSIDDIVHNEGGADIYFSIPKPSSILPYLSDLYGKDLTFNEGISSLEMNGASRTERMMFATKVRTTLEHPVHLKMMFSGLEVSVPIFGVFDDVIATSYVRLRPIGTEKSTLADKAIAGERSSERVGFIRFEDPPQISPFGRVDLIDSPDSLIIKVSVDKVHLEILREVSLDFVVGD